MSAPAVRPQVVPIPTAHAVTVSRGPRTETRGKTYAVMTWAAKQNVAHASPASALAALLGAIWAERETWWSPHTWEGDKRAAESWRTAAALAVDVDFHNAEGTHAATPPEMSARLEQAAVESKLPCNLFHLTPRGARLVYPLAHPVTDRELYERAIEGACVDARRALEALGLHARQDEGGRFLDGYAVDEGATDLARFLYAPRAIASRPRVINQPRPAARRPRIAGGA